jgi:squalene-hopene/tetraprenyl-beta-curcumene cyclase
MRILFPLLILACPALAADPIEFPQPERTTPDEPIVKKWSAAKAAEYLDGVGVNWTRDRNCITCHTNMPYLMARPMLNGKPEGWREVRAFLETDVAKWAKGAKPRGDAFVVATAAGLVFTDAFGSGKLSDASKQALATMWVVQKESGEWNWIKCDWPPLEHDDYFGAALAAVTVAMAPEQYADSDEAQAGLKKLRTYFGKTPAPDLHHQAMLLWASTKIPNLMTEAEQKKTIEALRKLQHKDGGWSLPSLGTYARRDKTMNDPNAPSDGYGTGFIITIFRQAGIPATDPAIAKGITWLKANQRESGRWYTRSLNNDKAHYITNAGTAFAVMALALCGENIEVAGR